MKFKCCVMSLLFVFNAHSFDGLWVGEGFSKTHRSERACSQIYFEFAVESDFITLEQGGYICGILQAEYPRSRFERMPNHDLMYEGVIVGSFNGNVFRLEMPSEFFQLELTLKEDKLFYRESWADGSSFLFIDGELRPRL